MELEERNRVYCVSLNPPIDNANLIFTNSKSQGESYHSQERYTILKNMRTRLNSFKIMIF